MQTPVNETTDSQLTVGQLAVSQPGALSVFMKYNIDYCCGGHRSIEEACTRIGLDPDKILREINESAATGINTDLRMNNWSSSFLIDFILENHHQYVANAIPEILLFLDKICEVHGGEMQELYSIRQTFILLGDELTSHMKKEETILFPAIKSLEREQAVADVLQYPIQQMEHEHTEAGDLVKEIRTLTDNYTPPEFACPTFRIAYQKLQEFDNDLMQHIHLENNILFERMKKPVL